MLVVDRPEGPWSVAQCRRKLAVRYALPGAHGYDRGTLALRRLRGLGAPDIDDLLTLAMPASWMVNNRATSPVFMAWLQPRLLRHWQQLVRALGELDVHGWQGLADYRKQAVGAHVQALCIDGQGVAAVSKVLAQLCPDLVPLMDDAAIAFLTGRVAMPDRADKPAAGHEHFVPMLDAFAAAVVAAEPDLEALAGDVQPDGLSPAQVLDRLLWFDSWGYGLFGRGAGSWWWVTDGECQGVVTLDAAPHAGAQPRTPAALDTFEDEALRAQAVAALGGGDA